MNPTLAVVITTLLIAGCASHGTWSKWDSGAWTTLDATIGSHEKSYYVEHWGEPVSRRDRNFSDRNGNVTTHGEELLWLWKPNGTGLSDQPGQGWELFLEFDQQETFRNWRIGTFRTSLTVPDVIAASRKHLYTFGNAQLAELKLSDEQHGISEARNKRQRLCAVSPEYCRSRKLRLDEIVQLQETVRVISAATFEADTATRNLQDRLATDSEVITVLESKRGSVVVGQPRRRSSTTDASAPQESDVPRKDKPLTGYLLGRGFLGPFTPNAYGPGLNSDATGRPFIWQPDTAGPDFFDPFLRVKPNAYGPGIGMDQYGRPVRPACPPGWAGPC